MISRVLQIPKALFYDRVITFLEIREIQDLLYYASALLNHRFRPPNAGAIEMCLSEHRFNYIGCRISEMV